jgi:hypothetical protein
MPDGRVLARGIHGLQYDQNPVLAFGIQQVLQGVEPLAKFIQTTACVALVVANNLPVVGIPLR